MAGCVFALSYESCGPVVDRHAGSQVPGKNLFPINEAIEKGTIIMNLLSDAAQSQTWKDIKPLIVRLASDRLAAFGRSS